MYIAAKALLTIRQVDIIRKKKFMVAVLDANNNFFMVYIVALEEPIIILIYLSFKIQVILLTSIEIFNNYFDFLKIFCSYSTIELPKYTRINNYFINLLDNKELSYGLIYSLELSELEILQIYIKTNLTSSSIRFFKSPTNI